MDIQKIKELALANGFKLKEQSSGNMDLNAYVYDFANAIEREAKAQADQKVKLLLCDEHLKKCESPTGIFNSQYPDEEPCLICLAKEAKAQVVPEGFVIVSQKDLLELTIAINAVDLATHTESKTNEVREMWQRVALKLMALGTAQEPTND